MHGPGDVQGQPIELDDEFASFIVKAYRLNLDGSRRVRRAFLSRSKGRSKSGLAAMLACFEALGPCRFDHFAEKGEVSDWGYEFEPGEPVGAPLIYAEVLNVATEEGQAGNTYDAIVFMLSPETCSPELLKDYGKIDVGLTRTILPNKRGFIEPVTSADSSKDGGKSTFIVADETHLWLLPRLKRLHGIMTRNLLKRRVASGWMLETSTMYAEGEDSVAEGTHAYAKSRKADRALLFDHRQASDTFDLEKPAERLAALAEAYGPAAEWMNLDAIAESWNDPQVSEAEFRRFWLNQPVPLVETVTALPVDVWTSLAASPPPIASPCFGADVDSAGSAFIAVAWRRPDGKIQVQLDGHARPASQLEDRCVELTGKWGGRVFAGGPALEHAGESAEPVSASEFAAGCQRLTDLIDDRRVHHCDEPLLNAAIEQAEWRTVGSDGARAWRLKDRAAVGPLAAVTRAVYGLVESPSVYEERGLVTIG